MGLMDRIKKVTGANDGFDESYEDDYYNGFDNDSYDDGVKDTEVQNGSYQQSGMATHSAPFSAPQSGSGISLSGSNIKMQVVHPTTYDGATAAQIANHLLQKSTVVLNLEDTNKETSRRLIDFLSGVAYSIGGSLKKIATNAYVITPSNVDVGDAQINQQKAEAAPAPAPAPAPDPEAPTAVINDFADFN